MTAQASDPVSGGDGPTPLVSVVIPAFNSARFLDSTLRSVQAQSFTAWECVVVDDGSDDETFAIACEYARLDLRFRAARIENSGPSAARNHGYTLTHPASEYVTFMDGDDLWLPHALATLWRRLQSDPVALGAHGLAEMIDDQGRPVDPGSYAARGRRRLGLEERRIVEWPLDRPTDFAVLVNGNVLFPPGLVLARRSGYERAGRFDERLRGPEDWDMLIRLSRHGYLSLVDEVILLYRRHDSNFGAAPTVAAQAWLTRCKAFHSPENTPEQQRIARLGWKAYQRDMAKARLRDSAAHLRSGRIRRGLDSLARVPVHLFRVLRGYPTPRLVRRSEPWK
jgi:alpha-1,3-rhamnosyltransferase